MFLMVAAVCVILTVFFQFKDGVTLERPITSYSLVGNLENPPSVFKHTD